jgi:DNA-binding MarR family transcriptional regulator
MMAIRRRENPTISELAEQLGADRTTMTRNLEQLAKRGFISIAQGKNLRSKAVRLEPKGKAALERSVSYWRNAQTKVVELLGEDRWGRMLSDLAVLSTLTAE